MIIQILYKDGNHLQVIAKQIKKDIPQQSPVIYPASDAQLSQAFTVTVNAGFTGSSYVNYENVAGGYIQWTVNVPTAGNYKLDLRFANGTDANRSMNVSVNNSSDFVAMDFSGTSAWTVWAESSIIMALNAGANTIKAIATSANGGPNVDYLKLEATSQAPTPFTQQGGNEQPSSSTPTIYVVSDSTAANYNSSQYPQTGWGMTLWNYFQNNVSVVNRARGGRSSKMFINEGLWGDIVPLLKEGDYVFLSFGINDSNYNNSDRYAPADTLFRQSMQTFINDTLAAKATPVLLTTILGLASYSNGRFVPSYQEYCNVTKELAVSNNVPLIDLNSLMVNYYNSIPYDTAYTYYMISATAGGTDKTHLTEAGAQQVSRIISEQIKGMKLNVSQYVK